MSLSLNRAAAVIEYLVMKGVPGDRLEAVGHGEEMPIKSNKTRKGREANRRVEFIIVNPGAPSPVAPAPTAPATPPAPPPP